MMADGRFAVPPPPLWTRKRKADAVDTTASSAAPGRFLSEAAFAAHSVDGTEHAGALAVDEERRWRRLVEHHRRRRGHIETRALSSAAAANASTKHLAQWIFDHTPAGAGGFRLAENVLRRQSALSIVEHTEYLRLVHKRDSAVRLGLPAILALTEAERAELARLGALARDEQRQFQRDLAKLAFRDPTLDYNAVPEAVSDWISERRQVCGNHVRHLYPLYYERQLDVVLRWESALAVDTATARPVMRHERIVHSVGQVPVLRREVLVQGTQVIPPCSNQQSDVAALPRPTWDAISADPIAEKLMEQYDCDVALSSSTLMALFNVPRGNDEIVAKTRTWRVPVKSRVCIVRGTPRRQLYLDPPLTEDHETSRKQLSDYGREFALSSMTTSEIPDPMQSSRRGRTSYHLWKLGNSKILVRTTTHVYFEETQPEAGTSRLPVSLFIKPDYRPFGIEEQLSSSERRCFWLHSWIRGGSTIVLGRMDPKTCTIRSWSEHTLASLADTTPDHSKFDPMSHFQPLHDVILGLDSVPDGNYLLRLIAPRATQPYRVEILRGLNQDALPDQATTGLVHIIPPAKESRTNQSSSTSEQDMDFIPPAWIPVPERIVFTYQKGSYCPEYLVDGSCPRESSGESCTCYHIALREAKEGLNWTFEDHQHFVVRSRNIEFGSVRRKSIPKLIPTFEFCKNFPQLPVSSILCNRHVVLKCQDASTCQVPHYSLHDIAERVADMSLRNRREKRRSHKASNRARQGNTKKETRD